MLEQLLVDLSYPFTANCAKCNNILFQIKLIDQFIRTKKEINKKQSQVNQDTAKFYMLHAGILPSTLFIQKTNFLCQQRPFYMQFLGQIKCQQCKDKIGIKILTVSSNFHHPQLLDRILININKVCIKTQKQDVTKQLISRFSQQWDDQTQIDQIDLSQNIMINNKQQKKQIQNAVKNKIINKPVKQQKNQLIPQIKQQKKQQSQQQLKYLRKQMEHENQQTKQIINQIVSSIDFFNQILISLEKRVSQTQNVCNVLKDKVQKIIPMLRKKNQN